MEIRARKLSSAAFYGLPGNGRRKAAAEDADDVAWPRRQAALRVMPRPEGGPLFEKGKSQGTTEPPTARNIEKLYPLFSCLYPYRGKHFAFPIARRRQHAGRLPYRKKIRPRKRMARR
jgi:hypothetical protein